MTCKNKMPQGVWKCIPPKHYHWYLFSWTITLTNWGKFSIRNWHAPVGQCICYRIFGWYVTVIKRKPNPLKLKGKQTFWD